MKIPLLPILSLLGLAGLGTVNAVELELQKGDMWAVDGGVFQSSSQDFDPANTTAQQLIIKQADGSLRTIKLDGEQLQKIENTSVIVDRTAPLIDVQWQGALQQPNGITIGPNTQVNLSVNEGVIKQFNTQSESIDVGAASYTYHFSQAGHEISVTAIDEFNNSSQLNIELNADFEPPQLSWQLAEPAIFSNQQWYAGKTAEVLLSASDNSSLDYFLINGDKLEANTKQVTMKFGDNIQVVDVLGNASTETIKWQQDDQAPYIVMNSEHQQLEAVKNITVRVNEVFELQSRDQGVGVGSQIYKSKYRQWLDLPKKFKFSSKGNYRIKIQSADQVGNMLETTVKVKVKR